MQPVMHRPPRPRRQPQRVEQDWLDIRINEEAQRLLKRDREEVSREPEPEKGPNDLEEYQQRFLLDQLAEKRRKLELKQIEKEQREKEQRAREEKEKQERAKRVELERLEKIKQDALDHQRRQ